MPKEIEHKYLIREDLWKKVVPEKSVLIRQAYLLTDPDKTIRIRTKGDQGFITIKGKTIGATRTEFEFEIPLQDALELIRTMCKEVIEKTRHYIHHNNKLWEVDVFSGDNTGLTVAEIELKSEAEQYSKPDWVDKEVTSDPKYTNSNLAVKPYCKW